MLPAISAFLGRFSSLFRKRRMESEMSEELAFHRDRLREKYLQEGMSASEAERAARVRFGDAQRWRERLREIWSFRLLEELMRDVRFSLRLLWKSPGFTAVAMATLALGVSANTAVFALIDSLLLRPLPIPAAHEMVVLTMLEDGSRSPTSFCTPFFRSLEGQSDVFQNVFAFVNDTLQVRADSGNVNVHGVMVSGQYFAAMQVKPLLGRYLTPADDKEGGSPSGFAIVISEQFWKNWFDGAPDVVGRKLTIANVPFTVVGVIPKSFMGADPTQQPQIYAPISADPIIDAPRDHLHGGTHAWWLTAMARLKPGIELDKANAALQSVSASVLHESGGEPEWIKDEEMHHFRFGAESGSNGFAYVRSVFRKPLLTMFAMCGGLLLLACLNLASLLLARGAVRERELATRRALGATRARLVRQLMIESLLLAGLGTGLGVAFAPMVSHALSALLSGGNGPDSMVLDASADWRLYSFAASVALIASVLIGLVPALRATDGDLNEQIKNGQHAQQKHARAKLIPRLLMISQVALALILVSGAALLATSLVRLYRTGLGFDPHGVVNIAFSMDKQQLDGDPLIEIYRQIEEGLKTAPGVKEVSFQSIVPLSHRNWNGTYTTPGGTRQLIWLNSVGPEYFHTMRIPVEQGRTFTWNDTKTSGMKIILNRSAAKRFFPTGDVVGRQILDRDKTVYEVVAVVGDVKYRDVRGPATPAGYVPIQQDPQKKPSFNAVVRVDGPWAPLVPFSRELAARLAPSIPAPVIRPMDDVVDTSISTERMMALLGLFFAGCSLLVTAIGLYGTLSYTTARRANEIGIRIALGAQRLRVTMMVFRENAVVVAIGTGSGLAVAVALSTMLTSFLYETSTRDPWILMAATLTLVGVASAASILPALRASWIDPMQAIRSE
ncbi:ABC transporter permease [Terriglobus albidus]|uniref:ABC transporter permease n=1 Tax=Terriglobus albidus TaxID=1592106 RepID=UPI0021E0D674|nr:ABC transporter permease [Terriglobus albidus]